MIDGAGGAEVGSSTKWVPHPFVFQGCGIVRRRHLEISNLKFAIRILRVPSHRVTKLAVQSLSHVDHEDNRRNRKMRSPNGTPGNCALSPVSIFRMHRERSLVVLFLGMTILYRMVTRKARWYPRSESLRHGEPSRSMHSIGAVRLRASNEAEAKATADPSPPFPPRAGPGSG
jgi:hypothetical protein